MPIETQLLFSALQKWILGEGLSSADFNRIAHFINSTPLQIDIPSEDQVQAQYAKLRAVLKERYVGK